MGLLGTPSPYRDAARLVNVDRLRGMILAVRNDVREFEPPPTPDETLVDLVADPYTSVDDAYDRLRKLETYLRDRGDRRSVFLTIYTRMTKRIHDQIERGGFENRDWMRAYTTTFANYYRRAFLAFERGDLGSVPDPWRIAFGSSLDGETLVLQDAFLGINAHINYDLALTLQDVGLDPRRPSKHADHQAVNEVLARLVDTQQSVLAELYASGLADVDETFGRLDEQFTLLSLTEGRAQAWRVAVVLNDVAWPPVESFARWVLRATATGGAYLVLGPALDSTVADGLRQLEREGPELPDVVTTLASRLDDA